VEIWSLGYYIGVKFGEYVTGGIMKVPENLGSIGANFAGLGISLSMWRAEV
jgi:hypothetical protein